MEIRIGRETLFYVLALIAIGFSLYAADLNNRFLLDDEDFVLENAAVQQISLANVERWFTENSYSGADQSSDYYRPVLLASFAITYALDGPDPFWYHMVCNFLHIANGLLVFWLLWFGSKRTLLAFLTALIFLIHPVQSEGVVFVASQGDLLASFFMLLGLIAWLKGIEKGKKILIYGASCVCLVLALLSRENAVIFPFLAIVTYIAFISRETLLRSLRDVFVYIWPHLLVVGTYLALRLTVLNFRDFLNFGNVDPTSVYNQDVVVRAYTFLPVLTEYLRTFFWPTNVHERLTFPIYTSFFNIHVWPVFLVLVGLLALLVWLYRNRKSDFKIWFFASSWFFIALVPASGIIPLPQIIQDHRLYLAMVGITFLCLYYLREGISYVQGRGFGWIQIPVLGAFALYLGFFSLLTIKRAILWGNPIALLEETLRYEPNSLIAYNSVGKYYLDAGEYDKAMENFLEAIERGTTSARPYYNLGLLYEQGPTPNLKKAIFYYKKALEINPTYKKARARLDSLGVTQ